MLKKKERYLLQLYITGTRPQSIRAIENIKTICERFLAGRYHLEVVDLYQQPKRAAEVQVIAAPTLIKQRPAPRRRFIGDLSDYERLLSGLNLKRRYGT
jgi:circadian clock protein KaiB